MWMSKKEYRISYNFISFFYILWINPKWDLMSSENGPPLAPSSPCWPPSPWLDVPKILPIIGQTVPPYRAASCLKCSNWGNIWRRPSQPNKWMSEKYSPCIHPVVILWIFTTYLFWGRLVELLCMTRTVSNTAISILATCLLYIIRLNNR